MWAKLIDHQNENSEEIGRKIKIFVIRNFEEEFISKKLSILGFKKIK